MKKLITGVALVTAINGCNTLKIPNKKPYNKKTELLEENTLKKVSSCLDCIPKDTKEKLIKTIQFFARANKLYNSTEDSQNELFLCAKELSAIMHDFDPSFIKNIQEEFMKTPSLNKTEKAYFDIEKDFIFFLVQVKSFLKKNNIIFNIDVEEIRNPYNNKIIKQNTYKLYQVSKKNIPFNQASDPCLLNKPSLGKGDPLVYIIEKYFLPLYNEKIGNYNGPRHRIFIDTAKNTNYFSEKDSILNQFNLSKKYVYQTVLANELGHAAFHDVFPYQKGKEFFIPSFNENETTDTKYQIYQLSDAYSDLQSFKALPLDKFPHEALRILSFVSTKPGNSNISKRKAYELSVIFLIKAFQNSEIYSLKYMVNHGTGNIYKDACIELYKISQKDPDLYKKIIQKILDNYRNFVVENVDTAYEQCVQK